VTVSVPGTLLNTLVGGWTIGYDGQYNSGTPIGAFDATYSIPYALGRVSYVLEVTQMMPASLARCFAGDANLA
jgi:hypothetical protein